MRGFLFYMLASCDEKKHTFDVLETVKPNKEDCCNILFVLN